MNYIIVLILAWSFCRIQGVCLLFLMNNERFPFLILAQSFLRPQGLGSAESGSVLLYSEHFGLCRIRRGREKESPKYKTKPKQTHPNPFFQRSIFDSSEKTRILDKFRTTFLCKTKPIYENCILSIRHQKRQKMRNKANLFPKTSIIGIRSLKTE